MQKLTADEIKSVLSINRSDWKTSALPRLADIQAVNELLDEKDIYTLVNDTELYDALHNPDEVFNFILDDYFLGYLDVEQNNSQVMIDLIHIYNR